MTEESVDEVFAVAGSAVEVPPPWTAGIVARARAFRTRQRRRIGAVVAAGLLVVGAATLLGTRSGSDASTSSQPPVLSVENPAVSSWWANDVLYLDHNAVQLPRVEDLVDMGDGAVIGDGSGGVVLVSPGGLLTTIGHKQPGAALVASAENGLVAWVDPGDHAARLVLYDADEHRVRSTLDLEPDGNRRQELADASHPVALDRETLYYADQRGDWRLRPPYDRPEKVDSGGLLDVSAAVVLRQLDRDTLDVVQPFFSVDHRLRGSSNAELSPGGEYVLTRISYRRPEGPFGPVRIYDARSGESLWTGLRHGDQVLATSLGPGDLVTYVVAHRADQPQAGEFVRMSFTGPYELRACHLLEQTCHRVARFPHTGALPVLAR